MSMDMELDNLVKDSQEPSRRKRVDEMALTTRSSAPRNQHEWHSTTKADVLRLESLTRHVFDQVNQNTAAEEGARRAMQEHAEKLKKKQRVKVNKRVKVHQEAIRTTYTCMKEIEHAMVQVEGALGRLTAERYARFAQSKVTEHRMELREKRPQQELYRDGVQRLLEKELEALNVSRKELLNEEAESKRLLEELQRDWADLAKDIGNRRLAMRHDLLTIASGEDQELYVSDDISAARSNEIVENAYRISADGVMIMNASEGFVKRIKGEAKALNKQVEECLRLHTKELAGMKTTLGQRIVESEQAIDKAGTQMRHMEQRAEMGDNTLKENIALLKALLRDLHVNKQNSVQDLRNKSIALDIDNSCRKVTAQVASSGPKDATNKKLAPSQSAPALGGASKMSSTGNGFPPGQSGNPQQGDVEQRKSFANFKGHNGSSPSSPSAGGSNPLKAGAMGVVKGH